MDSILTNLSTNGLAIAGIILLLVGIIVAVVMFRAGWAVLNYRISPIEKLSEKLTEKLDAMQHTLTEMNSKLWDTDTLDERIAHRVAEQLKVHERECRFNPDNKR